MGLIYAFGLAVLFETHLTFYNAVVSLTAPISHSLEIFVPSIKSTARRAIEMGVQPTFYVNLSAMIWAISLVFGIIGIIQIPIMISNYRKQMQTGREQSVPLGRWQISNNFYGWTMLAWAIGFSFACSFFLVGPDLFTKIGDVWKPNLKMIIAFCVLAPSLILGPCNMIALLVAQKSATRNRLPVEY